MATPLWPAIQEIIIRRTHHQPCCRVTMVVNMHKCCNSRAIRHWCRIALQWLIEIRTILWAIVISNSVVVIYLYKEEHVLGNFISDFSFQFLMLFWTCCLLVYFYTSPSFFLFVFFLCFRKLWLSFLWTPNEQINRNVSATKRCRTNKSQCSVPVYNLSIPKWLGKFFSSPFSNNQANSFTNLSKNARSVPRRLKCQILGNVKRVSLEQIMQKSYFKKLIF